MKNWDTHKRIVLSKCDKSFKASIDEPIVTLVDTINASKDFFTTSSCSGRIMLIREGDLAKRKNGASFTFVSHDLVSSDAYQGMFDMCSGIEGNVFLKLEPLILHIESRTLDLGIKLLHRLKRESEFKHTCIVSAANDKFIVCVKAMVKMEVPVVYNSELIIDFSLMQRYLDIANIRMKENFAAISKLTMLMEKGLLDHDISETIPFIASYPVPMLTPYIGATGLVIPTNPFTEYNLSPDLKTVVNMNGELFGTIPSESGRPITADSTHLVGSVLLVVSSNELWALVHYKKHKRVKFQWHKLIDRIAGSVAIINPTSFTITNEVEIVKWTIIV